jgi:hypothetical protein
MRHTRSSLDVFLRLLRVLSVGGIIFSFDQLLLEVGHNRVFSTSRPVVNCSVIRLEYW